MDSQGSGGRGGKLQGETDRVSTVAEALHGLSEVSMGEMTVLGRLQAAIGSDGLSSGCS